MTPIKAILLVFLLIAAAAVCITKRLLSSIIIFTSYSIVLSILWILLSAPDLAITEAAVSTGIAGVLFFIVLKRIQVMEDEVSHHYKNPEPPEASRHFKNFYNILSVIACFGITTVLLFTVSRLPPFGDPANPTNNEVARKYIEEGVQDTGAINIVAGMILDYRAFDTFGEICVLFAAVCAVLALLLRREGSPDAFDVILSKSEEPQQNIILKNTSFLLVAMILLFGCYVTINGHISPGGGFSGGAITGAALVLFASAYGIERAQQFINYKLYCRIVPACLIFYALVKGYSFYTGANQLSHAIPLGRPGSLFSAGLILPLNISVGIIVAFTIYIIFSLFNKGELK
jgi:multicomponent Na+:H+ antiporter subunit B